MIGLEFVAPVARWANVRAARIARNLGGGRGFGAMQAMIRDGRCCWRLLGGRTSWHCDWSGGANIGPVFEYRAALCCVPLR
mmetsp:Transcript_27483/g.33321  ORF Transcript_27483/g.33321 Transcript_27483/m.33321 type:complete len:81 (-) Transcript_27483:2-244(-)